MLDQPGYFFSHFPKTERDMKWNNELHTLKKNNKLELDGPVFRAMEKFLQQINVKRQEFHSNSFNGNHCHIIIKLKMMPCLHHCVVKY